MIAASCLIVLGALCGRLTFRPSWCHKHSAVTDRIMVVIITHRVMLPALHTCPGMHYKYWRMHYENLCSGWNLLVELPSGPAAQSRHHLWAIQMTAEGTLFGQHERGALWLLICGVLEKHLLTSVECRMVLSSCRPSDQANQLRM